MRFSSLGSGSEGNAWLFQPLHRLVDSASCVMVDCGFPTKQVVSRLARLGLEPRHVAGVVVTHEHDDHLGGVFKLSRRFSIPVYLTHGTWRAALKAGLSTPCYLDTGLVHLVCSHTPFSVAEFCVHPFPVPHDANEPIQLLLEHQGHVLGLLTDCGHPTAHLVAMLRQAQVLVLESNYCPDRLLHSAYPDSLKRRVGGAYGHLSNQGSCEILAQMNAEQLQFVVAAHLSQKNNCPDLVRRLWGEVLDPMGVPFEVACQHEGLAWNNVPDLMLKKSQRCPQGGPVEQPQQLGAVEPAGVAR